MKRSLIGVVAIVAAALVAAAGAAGHGAKGRALHVTKECSNYHGAVGEFCTIKSSNVAAIEPGMNVVYLAPLAPDLTLDSDLVLSSGQGGAAVGHVVLDVAAKQGRVTFSAGTGRFRHFRADVIVTQDDSGDWHWDGRYSGARSDDGED